MEPSERKGLISPCQMNPPHRITATMAHTRGFSGPYFSRAFLKGVGVWGVLSMEYF